MLPAEFLWKCKGNSCLNLKSSFIKLFTVWQDRKVRLNETGQYGRYKKSLYNMNNELIALFS